VPFGKSIQRVWSLFHYPQPHLPQSSVLLEVVDWEKLQVMLMIKCLGTTDQIKTHLLNKRNRKNNTVSTYIGFIFFHNKNKYLRTAWNSVPSDTKKLLDFPYTAEFVLNLHVKRGELNVRSGIT